MPDWKDEWTSELVISPTGRRLRYIRRRAEGYGFDEGVFQRLDDTMRYVFLWIGKLRRPADPPVVEILCHLLPEHEACFRHADMTILQRAFEEMV